MKKRNIIYGLAAALLTTLLFISCEPISVSVNSKGDVAFTRGEGVFFINLKTMKLSTIDWNYGKPTVPVIIRWSPDDKMLAYTVKDDKDSQNTSLYVADTTGKKKKVYTTSKVITQLEWSPDTQYVSLAQAGTDSDMSVADLVIVNAGGMSKTVVENAGDVHNWLDNSTLVYMKINEKNPNNSNIFKAELSAMNVSNMNVQVLKKAIVSKTGGLDCQTFTRQVVFTAIIAGDEGIEFAEDMEEKTYAFLINPDNKNFRQLTDKQINFLQFSTDGSKVLVKAKSSDDYGAVINLAYVDLKTNQLTVVVEDITDTVSANSSTIQAYPTWLDDKNILFWSQDTTYCSNGQELRLMGVDIATKKITNHQIAINAAIHNEVEAKGGYK